MFYALEQHFAIACKTILSARYQVCHTLLVLETFPYKADIVETWRMSSLKFQLPLLKDYDHVFSFAVEGHVCTGLYVYMSHEKCAIQAKQWHEYILCCFKRS